MKIEKGRGERRTGQRRNQEDNSVQKPQGSYSQKLKSSLMIGVLYVLRRGTMTKRLAGKIAVAD